MAYALIVNTPARQCAKVTTVLLCRSELDSSSRVFAEYTSFTPSGIQETGMHHECFHHPGCPLVSHGGNKKILQNFPPPVSGQEKSLNSLDLRLLRWSGRRDSNSRPFDPQSKSFVSIFSIWSPFSPPFNNYALYFGR